jgi:hypothetical protein
MLWSILNKMSNKLDEYLEQVVGKGDEGSSLLAKITAPTLKNCRFVDVVKEGMNGVAVLNHLPQDYVVVVHSVGGDPRIKELVPYVESMVDRLVDTSRFYGLEPLGFADVIDASKGEIKDIEAIGKALVEKANEYNIAILNGELAILGDRVNGVANVMGTMISITKKESNKLHKCCDNPPKYACYAANYKVILPDEENATYYSFFDHQNRIL